MNVMMVYDRQDYTLDMELVEKFSVRAIIRKNGKIAAQRGSRGDYKILGGGIDPGETWEEALQREVLEEAGLFVRPETIQEYGEVLEKRKDLFDDRKIFCCHSLYFFCEIEDRQVEPQMTESEKAKGYQLVWVSPE